jgi:choice-of-anchor C domain-containing protein
MEISMRFTRSNPAFPRRTAARAAAWLLMLALPLAARAVAIANNSLPIGVIQAPYANFTLTATGGTAPYAWSLASGALPAGLTLQGSGAITGTPTAITAVTATFRVTDAASATATKALTLTIAAPPVAAQWSARGLQGGAVSGIRVSPYYAADQTLFVYSSGTEEVFRSTDKGASWTRHLINPADAAGSISDLALSPVFQSNAGSGATEAQKTAFACSAGRLYKSADFGVSWARSDSGISGSCSQLGISNNYASDGTLWAFAVSGSTINFYASSNRGASWSLSGALPDGLDTPEQLAASPNVSNDGTFFAIFSLCPSGDHCLYASTDYGNTWNLLAVPVGRYSAEIQQVAFSPRFASDQTLFARGDLYHVFRSQDGGNSWTQLQSTGGVYDFGKQRSIGMSLVDWGAATPRLLVRGLDNAAAYTVWMSDDYGETFTPLLGAGVRAYNFLYTIGVFAASPRTTTSFDLFFGSREGLDVSYDLGLSYVSRDKGLNDSNAVSLTGSGSYLVMGLAYTSTNSSVSYWYKSADAGATWVKMPPPPQNNGDRLFGMSPGYAGDQTIFCGDGYGLFRSTNGGLSFSQVAAAPPQPFTADFAFAPGFAPTAGTLFVGSSSGLLRSTDGGQSFASVTSASGSCVFTSGSVYQAEVSANYGSDRTVFINPGQSRLCRSTDGGATWSQASALPVQSLTLSTTYNSAGGNGTHAKMLFAYDGATLQRSTDGGATFSPASGVPAGSGKMTAAVSPNFALDGTVLLATARGVYRSSDYGATFTALAAPDALGTRPVTAVLPVAAFDGRSATGSFAVAITGGAGVWRSADGGRSFQPVDGYQFVSAKLNQVVAIPNNAAFPPLLAATGDHGVFRSDDGGLTFANISKGMSADSNVLAVAAPSAQPARPLAAKNADGLWRYDDAAATWSRHPGAGSGDYRAFGEDGTYLYAMRRDGVSLRSADGGATWASQDASKTDLVSFSSDSSAGAPIVGDGDFELPVVAGALTTVTSPGTIGAWTVDSGSVDLIGSYWQAADGRQSLDMNGGGTGSITQTLATTAGKQYTVRFSLAANPDTVAQCNGPVKTLQVFWNGSLLAQVAFDRTGHTAASMGWVTKQFTVTASGAATALRFLSLDSGVCGPALDAVSVTPYGAPLQQQKASAPNMPDSVAASLWSVSAAQGPMFSYNSGTNWTAAPGSGDYALPGGQSWQVIQAAGLDTGTGGRIVSAGSATTLWLTRDGGLSWRAASGAGSGLEATSRNFTALIGTLNANNTTDLLVGVNGSTNGGVYLSGDDGEHWTQINQGFDPNTLNITSLAKTSCSGCPVQYYSGTFGSGVYTRTIPVVAAPSFPSASAACFGSTGCACVSTAGSGPEQGGQAFKICGANFQASAVVEFDGVPATGCSYAGVPAVITCTATPPHVPGAALIRVRNPDTRAGTLPNGYNYLSGAPRVAANSLKITKTSNSAKLSYTCSGCTTPPPQIYRSQNAAFSLNVEQFTGGATNYTDSGVLAATANPTYFWSVE